MTYETKYYQNFNIKDSILIKPILSPFNNLNNSILYYKIIKNIYLSLKLLIKFKVKYPIYLNLFSLSYSNRKVPKKIYNFLFIILD
jgi:hypothetical protein